MEFCQKYISIYFLLIFLPQVHLQKSDSDDQILSLLNEQVFLGRWKSTTQKFNQFNYFDEKSGIIQVRFENDHLQFLALNPKYYEEKHVVAEFKVSNYSESLQAFIGKTQLYLKGGLSDYQPWIESFCQGTYKIKLNQKLENLDINKLEIDVDLESYSDTCYDCLINMSFHVTRDYDFDLARSFIATILQVVQLYSFKIKNQLLLQQTLNQFVSLLALILFTILEIEAFNFLMNSLFQNIKYFQFDILPIIVHILTFIIILLIYMFVRKSRKKSKIIHFWILESCLIMFIVDLVFFQQFGTFFYVMLAQAFVLYPQIIHNIRLGINYQFNKLYIFGLLSSHIFSNFYSRSCSNNVMGLKPDYLFVRIYLTIYILSLILIILQIKYGSRCFIPKFLQPILFLQKVEVNNSMECAICLNYLYLNSIDMNDQSLDCQIVVTPCLHEFHSQCLEKWIEVKMNCPLCRSEISSMKQDNN